jgi:hypothetical protein
MPPPVSLRPRSSRRRQLALSTQCGFASAGPGNEISEAAQRVKLGPGWFSPDLDQPGEPQLTGCLGGEPVQLFGLGAWWERGRERGRGGRGLRTGAECGPQVV